jgi:hypothetical protein
MAYLKRFTHDIFISHGWSRNRDEGQGDRGWVLALARKLQLELTARLGSDVTIFVDAAALPRNGSLAVNIQNALRDSAVFLGIITPGFCRQDGWCRRELETFLSNARAVAANRMDRSRRLFKVVSRPVPPAEEPATLREVAPFSFFEGEPGLDYQGYSLGSVESIDLQPDSRISTEYQRLAPALASLLYECRQTQERMPIRTVFLGEMSTSHEIKYAQRLRDELEGHEVVLAPTAADATEESYTADVSAVLAACDRSIHLLDGQYGPVPTGWNQSVSEIQIRCASARRGDFRALAWVDKQSIAGERQEAFLQQLRMTLGGAVDLVTQGIEYLLSNFREILDRPDINRNVQAYHVPPGRTVYLQCMKRDLDRLELTFREFTSRGVLVQLPLFDGKKDLRAAYHRRFLERCRGTVIYWGRGADTWTQKACDDTVEALGEQLDSKLRLIGIDPPDELRRRYFHHDHFQVVPFPNGFGAQAMDLILNHLGGDG